MYKKADLKDFELFLQEIKRKKYEFIFFRELKKSHNQVIIRHDIDFDVMIALELAKIEHANGVKATFFFLMSNDSYNPFSRDNFNAILKIKQLGHMISIHFDPVVYKNFEEGFKVEKKLFETAFETNVDVISLHRPNEYFQNHNEAIDGCEHTYMEKYFKKIKYVSDSSGVFRYGHPFNTDEFQNNQSLQILIHPIWWVIEGDSNHDKLRNYYSRKKEFLKSHYSANCKPFNAIKHELD